MQVRLERLNTISEINECAECIMVIRNKYKHMPKILTKVDLEKFLKIMP